MLTDQKPFYPEELIARIKDRFEIGVHESVQEESFHFGNTTFNYTTNEIRTGNNKVLITSRQADILRILATNLNLAVDRDLLLETISFKEVNTLFMIRSGLSCLIHAQSFRRQGFWPNTEQGRQGKSNWIQSSGS